jgi:hypothetical protein
MVTRDEAARSSSDGSVVYRYRFLGRHPPSN